MDTLSESSLHLGSHREETEAVISQLAVEGSARFAQLPDSDKGMMWIFKYGTVKVFVVLSGETDDDTLTVWSPVVKLPVNADKEAALFKYLLQSNWLETWESRFALREDEIVLHTVRTLDSIDPAEISRAITIIASLADEYDEEILKEYGGTAP